MVCNFENQVENYKDQMIIEILCTPKFFKNKKIRLGSNTLCRTSFLFFKMISLNLTKVYLLYEYFRVWFLDELRVYSSSSCHFYLVEKSTVLIS